MAVNVTLEDLAEWEKDFQEELSQEFGDVEDVVIEFVNEDLVNGIIKNVQPIVLNVNRLKSAKKQHAKSSTRSRNKLEKLPFLKLFKSFEELDPKEIIVKSIEMVENDRIYFIGPSSLQEMRKIELNALKVLSTNEDVDIIKENMNVITGVYCTLPTDIYNVDRAY